MDFEKEYELALRRQSYRHQEEPSTTERRVSDGDQDKPAIIARQVPQASDYDKRSTRGTCRASDGDKDKLRPYQADKVSFEAEMEKAQAARAAAAKKHTPVEETKDFYTPSCKPPIVPLAMAQGPFVVLPPKVDEDVAMAHLSWALFEEDDEVADPLARTDFRALCEPYDNEEVRPVKQKMVAAAMKDKGLPLIERYTAYEALEDYWQRNQAAITRFLVDYYLMEKHFWNPKKYSRYRFLSFRSEKADIMENLDITEEEFIEIFDLKNEHTRDLVSPSDWVPVRLLADAVYESDKKHTKIYHKLFEEAFYQSAHHMGGRAIVVRLHPSPAWTDLRPPEVPKFHHQFKCPVEILDDKSIPYQTRAMAHYDWKLSILEAKRAFYLGVLSLTWDYIEGIPTGTIPKDITVVHQEPEQPHGEDSDSDAFTTGGSVDEDDADSNPPGDEDDDGWE